LAISDVLGRLAVDVIYDEPQWKDDLVAHFLDARCSPVLAEVH
jgi:hypothetical protein